MRLFSLTILTLLLVATGATGYLLLQEHRKEEALLRAALSEGVERQLDSLLSGATQNFTDYIKDFGGWDLVGDFVGRPDKGWADANIGAVAAKKGIDQVWLYNENLDLVYSYGADDSNALQELPLAKADLKTLITKSFPLNFFAIGSNAPLEIFAGKIEPASVAGKVAKPFGYIFAARRWSSVLLENLSKSTNTIASIEPGGWNAVPDAMSAVTFFKPLAGWDGAPVLALKVTRGAEILDSFNQLRTKMVAICLGYGLAVLVIALLLALQFIRQAAKPQAVLNS